MAGGGVYAVVKGNKANLIADEDTQGERTPSSQQKRLQQVLERLSGYSGGEKIGGMASRSELSIHHINRSAAAFSSEKAAGLRRCAETQKHFARCGAA